MKKRSLNFKLALVMGILILGSVVIAGIGLSRMEMINTTLDRIVKERSARVSLVKDIQSIFYLQLSNIRSYILEESPEGMEKIEKLMSNRNDEMLKKIDGLSDISTEVGKAEMAKFRETYQAWWAVTNDVRKIAQTNDDKRSMALLMEKGNPLRITGEEIVDSTVDRNEKAMIKDAEDAANDYQHARTLMLLVSGVAILLGVSFAWFVLASLSKSVNGVIENLTSASDQVSSAAQQIASSSEELSQATTEQASSLEETVATIEELSSMVKVNSENASQAAQLSNETSEIAGRGEQEIRALVSSMGEISHDSKKIADIINVIDDIAFQTNLLALNAAVEAARAGEQGKGFAVVAEAVRSLAQRSSSAAKDITELIKASVERIENGSEQAERSGAVLVDIVAAVKKVTQINNEIASASTEQANGITQISKAMNQLDQVTQVNAASSEEAAASAEELSAQADSMSHVISTLVEVIKGQDASHATPTPVVASKAPARKTVKTTSAPLKAANSSNEDLLPLNSAS
ncbi:methyl-accepting chemotaxis protein [Bdellovibrio bacteriovorus]|uniref:methyl-accepting chemotaxis protein n=1 Tax=Bdellovibrio bacteriovorus TaxID=959 RepID=UPI0035A9387E